MVKLAVPSAPDAAIFRTNTTIDGAKDSEPASNHKRIGIESLSPRLSVVQTKNVQPVADLACAGKIMTKLIGLLLILAMIVHLIKPLGLPFLKRRGDFWKIAILAFALWAMTLLLRDFT
jgi:hypothetical protein